MSRSPSSAEREIQLAKFNLRVLIAFFRPSFEPVDCFSLLHIPLQYVRACDVHTLPRAYRAGADYIDARLIFVHSLLIIADKS